MAAIMAMAASEYSKVFEEEPRPTPTPQPKPKSFDEQLSDKGLQRFEINGKVIIAHNEREAQKRYRKRYK